MKRWLLGITLFALSGLVSAQAFVWPNAWTTADPSEVTMGGTLRSYSVGEPRTFNPLVSAESTAVRDQIMLSGAALIILPPDSDEFIPYAAESFEISEDGTVVDVVLRDGILWSDGTPVTVDDYLFRYQAETDPDVGSNAYDTWFINEQPITLEKTGENSLRFTFPVPDREALPVVSMLPAPDHILGEIYREGGAEAIKAAWGTDVNVSETVWTGPFVPTSFRPGERITLSKNPHFGEWNVDEAGNPLPYLDEYSFSIVQDADAGLNLYLAGEIDVFTPRNLDDIGVINNAIQNGDIDATVLEDVSPVDSSQFIVFNWNQASDPFQEELFRATDFRRAMSHLVDREALIELVYGGAASPMWSNVYQVLDYWVNPDVAKYPYDPEAAAELLAGLGFRERNSNGFLVDEEGNELGFTLATNAGNNEREQIAQIFADSAREAGVNVSVQTLDFNLLVDQLLSEGEDRPFDAILIGLTGGSRIWPFGSNVIPCTGNLHMYNTSGECLVPQEQLMQRLYNDGRATLDTEAAREIGFEIQAIQAELQPQVYTVSPSQHYSWLSSVGGEHPGELIDSLVGSRELELTFKRQ